MTTITSNNNEFSGKVHNQSASMQDKYEYNKPNNFGGCVVVVVLAVVAVVLITVVIPALLH